MWGCCSGWSAWTRRRFSEFSFVYWDGKNAAFEQDTPAGHGHEALHSHKRGEYYTCDTGSPAPAPALVAAFTSGDSVNSAVACMGSVEKLSCPFFSSKSYSRPPTGAPNIGPNVYTQNPLRGPGKATLPQPAMADTIRGPKSRAGFQPAWVSGAYLHTPTRNAHG